MGSPPCCGVVKRLGSLYGCWARACALTIVPADPAAPQCVTVLAVFLGAPMLGSTTAFNNVVSLSTTALLACYAAPILLRITAGAKRFTPGRFTLGRWAYPIG
jgi:hypothetical protein